MPLEVVPQAKTKSAGALSMNHQNSGKSRKNSIVDEFLKDRFCFINSHTAYIDLRTNLCRFFCHRAAGVNFVDMVFSFAMSNKRACTHFDNGTKAADLHSEFLPLKREYGAFLCKCPNIHRVTDLNITRVYILSY